MISLEKFIFVLYHLEKTQTKIKEAQNWPFKKPNGYLNSKCTTHLVSIQIRTQSNLAFVNCTKLSQKYNWKKINAFGKQDVS